MKKLYFLKTMLLLCALIAGSSAWADTEVVFTPGTDTGESSVTKGDVTVTMTTMNNASYYQIYANNSGTFTCANGNITKIEFTCTASGTSKYGPGNASVNVGSYSYSGNKGTWTGSASSVTISSTSQVRMSSLTITYAPASTDPSISASVSSLAFGEVEATGSKELTFKVTPSNLTANLTLSTNNAKYTVSPTSISKDATGAQTITVTANPTSVNDNMSGKVIISGDDFDSDTEVALSTTVIRKDAELAFDPISITLTKGDSFTAPTFSKATGIDNSYITFTSSYNDVASVSSAGVITLGSSTGTAIITATFAQNDVFSAGEATCTIKVDPDGVTPEPSAGGYYEKVTLTDDLEDGNYLIVYENSQVALNGNLASSGVDEANNTISFTFDDDDNINVSDDTEAAEFEIKAITGGYSVKSVKNSYYLTHTGTKNTLNTSENAVANGISFTNNGDAIIAIDDSYHIRYNSASGQQRFRYYTSDANVQLYKKVAGSNPTTIDIYVSAAGLATYASNYDLDYSSVSGLEAYIAKQGTDGIELKKVNKVTARTGVLLRATDSAGKNYSVPVTTASTDDVSGNLFMAGEDAAVASEAGGKYNYILNVVNNKIGFYKANGQTVAKNRAYLQTSTTAARIDFSFADEETGIFAVHNSQRIMNDEVYDLQGRHAKKPTKGMYVVNSKKFFVK